MIPLSSDRDRSFSSLLQILAPILKKEIALMRDVLANFHQEELSLLERKNQTWETILAERSELIVALFLIRKERNALLKLVELFPKELLQKAEIVCEISSQMDQLIALLDRANLQNCRNDALFQQAKEEATLPLYCSYPHPLRAKEKIPLKKTTLATAPKNHL